MATKKQAPKQSANKNTPAVNEKDKMAQMATMSLAEIERQNEGYIQSALDVLGVEGWGAVIPEQSKRLFCGKPFLVCFVQFNDGDYGEFVSLFLITRNDEKFILNDGSSGIYRQCRGVWDSLPTKELKEVMMVCPGGLRVSDYEYEDDNGEIRPAHTFYLNTQADAINIKG